MSRSATSVPIAIALLHRALLALTLALACAGGSAQERAAGLPSVTISAQANRDPVEKSYRRMVRGMDLFERRHALAPAAALRFRLLPRHRDTNMRDIRLDVVGNSTEFRVPIDPDDTFVLPRDRQALAEDAMVVPNRKRQSMTWRTEIRTPGLPPQTRRLGDLRLECEVGMEAGLISERRGFFDRLFNSLAETPDYCHDRNPRYLLFSDQPLFSVTLVAGQRRETLPVAQLFAGASEDPQIEQALPSCDCQVLVDRTYFLPLGDSSWPDDTLVEFEPMAGAADAAPRTLGPIVAGSSTRADVRAAFPRARVIRFDSAYEVWVDRDRPDPRDRRDPREIDLPERVLLVDPTGIVTKVRLRLPANG